MSTPDLNAHLTRAAALNAAGDHDGAVNELAFGTQKGDLQCTRQLGLRLLTGDRAPLLPAEGLQFLGEDCDGGLAEAAARAAGILALGVSVASNWPLALAWLCRSAAAGWEPARRQLLALCDDRALAAAPPRPPTLTGARLPRPCGSMTGAARRRPTSRAPNRASVPFRASSDRRSARC